MPPGNEEKSPCGLELSASLTVMMNESTVLNSDRLENNT